MRKLIHELYGDLPAWGRFWLHLGLVTLACAAAMSFAFGLEISWTHALFLACLTGVAAFLPEAAYSQWEEGRRGVSVVLALFAAPLLLIEFYSHAGYTAGLRGLNVEVAAVQNTRFDGAQDAVTDDKANIGMWRKQLATLMEQHAWAGTVKADGLKAEISVLDEAIAQEAARVRCAAKCLDLKAKKADLEKRISVAEQAGDLSARIEATQRILDRKRDVARTTEHKSSAVTHQNAFLARSVSLVSAGSLEPSKLMTEAAQQSVTIGMAAAGTGLPALALFVAGLYRRRKQSGSNEDANDTFLRLYKRACDAKGLNNLAALRDGR